MRIIYSGPQQHLLLQRISGGWEGPVCSRTLYTVRSCSPSLRVVPSYLISFTKDKAKIFSDLSFAARGKKNRRHKSHGEILKTYFQDLFCKTTILRVLWGARFLFIFLPEIFFFNPPTLFRPCFLEKVQVAAASTTAI